MPLVLFEPEGYGASQGQLMVPARTAQALSPWLFELSWIEGVPVRIGVRGAWAPLPSRR